MGLMYGHVEIWDSLNHRSVRVAIVDIGPSISLPGGYPWSQPEKASQQRF